MSGRIKSDHKRTAQRSIDGEWLSMRNNTEQGKKRYLAKQILKGHVLNKYYACPKCDACWFETKNEVYDHYYERHMRLDK